MQTCFIEAMFYVLLISHRNIYGLIVNKTSMMLFIKSLNTMREVIRIVFEDILFKAILIFIELKFIRRAYLIRIRPQKITE